MSAVWFATKCSAVALSRRLLAWWGLTGRGGPLAEYRSRDRDVLRRTQLLEYLEKVRLVGQAIAAGQFYKRPGWWCGGCDYLPVCVGDHQKVRETFLQVSPADNP